MVQTGEDTAARPGQAPVLNSPAGLRSRTDRLLAALSDFQKRAASDRRVRRAGGAAEALAFRVVRAARVVTGSIRPLGWMVVVLTAVAWVVGVALGWVELLAVAGVGLSLLILCGLFLVGGSVVSVVAELYPNRVVAGQRASGRMVVTNQSGRHLLPLRVDLPVGGAVAAFDVPLLAPSHSHEELFHIPTDRRGVIDVGPARVVRGDPLGLLARVVSEARPSRLYVHPRTVRVPTIGGGFLRDLEGQESPALSPSDIAFHSLREYVAGDDRRHVHWRTSARTSQLMVQQYVDTRRAHVLVVLDTELGIYDDLEEFETAVSVTGSLGIRALRDKQNLTVVAGRALLASEGRNQLLDGLSGVEGDSGIDAPNAAGEHGSGLLAAAKIAARCAPGASIVVLVTGGKAELPAVRQVSRRFTPDARIVAVRISSRRHGFQAVGHTALFDVEQLGELSAVVRGGMRS
ncbi:MAG: DUF58 domain-containing protein [Actinomycetota bacterium]|nr:DUF58 domain-containing protein [Actinomycetota bacterium]